MRRAVERNWPQRIRTSITGTKIRGPAIGRGATKPELTARKKLATSYPDVTYGYAGVGLGARAARIAVGITSSASENAALAASRSSLVA